ncbi:MAG: AraC family transcriptional regulator [Carboxylicivirga sp.]|jgi:AraC-like DNA-binding protein|nr:AraC family transcriptional regulator [Carboxylicivirga sp.]
MSYAGNEVKLLLIGDKHLNVSKIHKSMGECGLVYKTYSESRSFEKIVLYQPDIIVIVSCKEDFYLETGNWIKNTEGTYFIPVVIVTENLSNKQMIKAYNLGVDLIVDFNIELKVLIASMLSLIRNRQKIQSAYNNDCVINHKNREQLFIDKVLKIVNDNYENPEFEVRDFSTILNKSRTWVYLWFKNVTGGSASDFLRNYRLNKSVRMLKAELDLNISEIAYKVGFSDPKYFSKQFKKQYGISPMAFRKRNNVSGLDFS